MSSINNNSIQMTPTKPFAASPGSTSPTIENVSVNDWSTYVDSGITVTINTPLVKDSLQPLFGINLDGFIPDWRFIGPSNTTTTRRIASLWVNMFPVQCFPNSKDFVKIKYDMLGLPIQSMYMSHRFMAGAVNVGLRIMSNTTQSGNLSVYHAKGCVRQYYSSSETYEGLRFLNCIRPDNFVTQGFSFIDLSLNRNCSITSSRNDPMKYLDLPQKIRIVNDETFKPTTVSEAARRTAYCQMFAEDWLLVSIPTTLPDQNANQITIRVLFDYSQVEFYVPMYMFLSCVPTNFDKQILNYSETFVNKVINTIGNKESSWTWNTPSNFQSMKKNEIVGKMKTFKISSM